MFERVWHWFLDNDKIISCLYGSKVNQMKTLIQEWLDIVCEKEQGFHRHMFDLQTAHFIPIYS